MFKHVPNLLTILRFILAPFIVVLIIQDKYLAAFIVFTISSISDILDGIIARKFNFITDFGKLMDPLADKITQLSILITLTFKHIIPIWMIVIVLLKELTMIIGGSFLYKKDVVVFSKWYGKLSTVLFYFAIACSLIKIANGFDWNVDILYYFATFFTVFSLIMYFNYFYREDYLVTKKSEDKMENDKK